MKGETSNFFEKNFDYGSLLPLLLFILGIYTIYLFLNEKPYLSFMIMILSFVVYVGNNVLINYKKFSTINNEYLEDLGSYVAFSLTTVVFGLIFFKEDLLLLTILFFYSICQLLAMSRNWVQKTKNSNGWPLPLNGIFFPFFYFLYKFYLIGFGEAIFVVLYIVIAILSISEHNFLGYEEDTKSVEKTIEKIEKKIQKLP